MPNGKVIGGTDIADSDNAIRSIVKGHGTEVAGVIAGPTGVAPGAKIVAIKIFPSKNATNASCSDTASFSDIFTGMNFAVMKKAEFGITVINLSLGGSFDDSLDHWLLRLGRAGLRGRGGRRHGGRDRRRRGRRKRRAYQSALGAGLRSRRPFPSERCTRRAGAA